MPNTKNDVQSLLDAARLNREDPLRDGSLLRFPDYGQVVMTGDMHGHQRNFAKLQKYAELDRTPARHVMLHELIHCEHNGPIGDDDSIELVVAAARWKIEYPDQIHFLQSNHEMSQLTGKEICKGGRIVNYDFECNITRTYGTGAPAILDALREFIMSFPLAARTPNRIFLSHSLPGKGEMARFDHTILERSLEVEDMQDGGHAYVLVWGRYHPKDMLDKTAELLDVDYFLCGHQPQEDGFEVVHDRMIILASDHNHGVFLPFDLKKRYEINDLARLIRPFSAVS